ncbi:hypothetical protein Vadar_020881 [Vaccinium darrowii]|uniref:Uncharacterized protein n=1 Tax=Vaccinium darrowii TaxID=229202 RepID=A0ACB7Y1D0_9ERIC|nr:hypothetical protein Vadar_020881 [Vaccinium darrowii]
MQETLYLKLEKHVLFSWCVVRLKKGDHWTSQCPYKDLAPPSDVSIDKQPSSEVPTTSSGPSKGPYVPPSQKPGVERSGKSCLAHLFFD